MSAGKFTTPRAIVRSCTPANRPASARVVDLMCALERGSLGRYRTKGRAKIFIKARPDTENIHDKLSPYGISVNDYTKNYEEPLANSVSDLAKVYYEEVIANDNGEVFADEILNANAPQQGGPVQNAD